MDAGEQPARGSVLDSNWSATMSKANRKRLFGDVLREKRMEKGFSLRKFAQLVGVSPTYLSQVEQSNVDPPTAARVRRMAEILGEDVDELSALAGRLSEDLPEIIREEPKGVPGLLRAVRGMTADQLRRVREEAERIKQNFGNRIYDRCPT
jgi:transcriptional regulator with XRE-family HTH domain